MRKLLSTALMLGFFASISCNSSAIADVAAGALPTLNNAVNADITTSGSNMNVQINAGTNGLGTINWADFNVGKDAAVNYEFTAHNQTALNKVDAAGGLSQIYGKITSSGCAGCGYDATGKVILINPNGVLFGDGANVNLNSFTVSTMDGSYDTKNNQLNLDRNATSQYGIIVQKGAKIHGDKGVTFASDNVSLYNGSKITTNVAPNVDDASFGKVKIVTSDGVNFTYYQNGAVKEISGIKGSSEKMVVSANGEIHSGNIDIRNYSSNVDSEINLNGAALKATKAVTGNDGNIWLTASNKVVLENADLDTVNFSDAAADRNTGNIRILAGNKASITTSNLNSVGKVDITSQNGDAIVDKTTVVAGKDFNLTAGNIASVQNNSSVNADNININGAKRTQVVNSGIIATNDVNLQSPGDMVWASNSEITAGKDVNLTASNGYLLLNDAIVNAKNNINLTSKDSITSAKLNGSYFVADKDVNLNSTEKSVLLTSTNQFDPKNTLNLTAKENVEINSEGDLETADTNITAGKNIFLSSANGSLNVYESTKFAAAQKIYLNAANNVKTSGSIDTNNIQTNISAGNDVDVELTNAGNRQNGLVAKAGNNMTITTDGTLSVSDLRSGNDMTLNANKVIAGLPYTNEEKLPVDNSERSYIEVGGTFNSNVENDNYTVTASGDRTSDGKYNQRHHIQYGEQEKILLVNKRPVDNEVTDPSIPDIDNGDDVDVVNPGDVSDDTKPTDPDQGGTTPGGDEGNTPGGDDEGNTPGGDDTKPGEGEECPDVPNDDIIEDEQEPDLVSTQDLVKYAMQTKDQRKF